MDIKEMEALTLEQLVDRLPTILTESLYKHNLAYKIPSDVKEGVVKKLADCNDRQIILSYFRNTEKIFDKIPDSHLPPLFVEELANMYCYRDHPTDVDAWVREGIQNYELARPEERAAMAKTLFAGTEAHKRLKEITRKAREDAQHGMHKLSDEYTNIRRENEFLKNELAQKSAELEVSGPKELPPPTAHAGFNPGKRKYFAIGALSGLVLAGLAYVGFLSPVTKEENQGIEQYMQAFETKELISWYVPEDRKEEFEKEYAAKPLPQQVKYLLGELSDALGNANDELSAKEKQIEAIQTKLQYHEERDNCSKLTSALDYEDTAFACAIINNYVGMWERKGRGLYVSNEADKATMLFDAICPAAEDTQNYATYLTQISDIFPSCNTPQAPAELRILPGER